MRDILLSHLEIAFSCHFHDNLVVTYLPAKTHLVLGETEARLVNTEVRGLACRLQSNLPVSVTLWSGGSERTWFSRIFKVSRFGGTACVPGTLGVVPWARPLIPRDSRRPLYIHFCSFLTVTAGGLRKGGPSWRSSLPLRITEDPAGPPNGLSGERPGILEPGGRRQSDAAARALPLLQPSIPPPRGGCSSRSPRAPHLIQLSLGHRWNGGNLAPTRRLSRLLLQDSRIRGVGSRPPPDSLGGDRGGDTCCGGRSLPPRSPSRRQAPRSAAPPGEGGWSEARAPAGQPRSAKPPPARRVPESGGRSCMAWISR
jgi:hypothetical protein